MARACEGGAGGRLWNLEELEGAAKGFHQLFQTSKSESGRKSLVAKETHVFLSPMAVLCSHGTLKSHFLESEADSELKSAQAASHTATGDIPSYVDWARVSLLVFRTLRNLCVGSAQVQNDVVERDILPAVIATSKAERNLATAGGQLLVNISAGNSTTRSAVWDKVFPGLINAFSKHPDPKLVGIGAALLHTCAGGDAAERLKSISTSRGLSVLSRLISTLTPTAAAEKLIPESRAVPENPWAVKLSALSVVYGGIPSIDWLIHTLSAFMVHFVSELDQAPPALSRLYMKATNGGRVFHAWANVMNVLTVWAIEEPREQTEKIFSRAAVRWLAEWVASDATAGVPTIAATTEDKKSGEIKKSPGKRRWKHSTWRSLAVHAALRLLAAISSKMNPKGRSAITRGNGVVSASMRLLKRCSGMTQVDGKEVKRESPYMFRSDVLSLIGNLCHANKPAQVEAASGSGLELILSQTFIDYNNPMQREYAILATRNLAVGNAEVQKRISELKLTGVSNTDQLARLGLQTATGEDGTVRITRVESEGGDTGAVRRAKSSK